MCAKAGSQSIPHYASTLVGRSAEISLVTSLILDPEIQLITLTGSAGVGKTRLATHITRSMELRDTDVLFVPLATVSDPNLVVAEIGKALGLQGDNLAESIRAQLASAKHLIVLDNFEQVIQAASDLAAILPYNQSMTVLITSQRSLQLDGERVVRLDPLPVPEPDTSAEELRLVPSVQLLVDRALGHDNSLEELLQSTEAMQAVADICRRLDGIPLAIELAASRLSSLSPEVVLAQLEQGQHILSSQRRSAPERQRTMHSAIRWSFQLLPGEHQQVFLWLGVFTSGFDLDIVQSLTRHLGRSTPAIDIVSELMHLNLIRRVSGGAHPWYSMLVSIREFCLTELDESGERVEAETFVADYILKLASESEAQFSGLDSAAWIARLSRELATTRAVVRWAQEHNDPRVPILVASGMQSFFMEEGAWREVVGWIDGALVWKEKLAADILVSGLLSKLALHEDARVSHSAGELDAMITDVLKNNHLPTMDVKYLLVTGNMAILQHDWPVAEAKFRRALEVTGREGMLHASGIALGNLGNIYLFQGDYDTALRYMRQCKEMLEQTGDLARTTRLLANLASTSNGQGDYWQSLVYLEEAEELTERLGLRHQRIWQKVIRSAAHEGLGEIDEADTVASEAITLAREFGYLELEIIGVIRLANGALYRQDVAGVYGHVQEGLRLQAKAHGDSEYVQLGALVASALELEGRYAESTKMLAKSLAYGKKFDFTFWKVGRDIIEQLTIDLRNQLPDFDEHWLAGEAWSDEDFIQCQRTFSRRHTSMPQSMLINVKKPSASGLTGLTGREREILQLLTEGHSTRGMADHLSLSPRTVTTHIGNIMAKLEVSSRTELLAKVMRTRQN